WLLWLPFVPFALLVALAAPTIVRGARGGFEATGSLLMLTLVANLVVVLAFYVSSRYRLPSVPPLLAFAAATVVAVADRPRAEVYRTAAVVAVLFIVLHVEKDRASVFQEANQHFNVATAWT